MEAIDLTIYPKDIADLNAFKAFAKAMKIKMEIKDKAYKQDFVEKILFSEEQINQGKTKKIKKEDFKKFLNL